MQEVIAQDYRVGDGPRAIALGDLNNDGALDFVTSDALGQTTRYDYDALNRQISITQSGNGVINKRVDLSYDAASQRTNIARYADPLGTLSIATSDYSYDLAGRLTRLSHRNTSTTYADYQWAYDAANRITQFISPDGTSNYSYDSRDQLTNTDHSYQSDEAYGYDANGNRTNAGYQTGSNNQLLSDGTYTYAYDNEGNRTRRTNLITGEVTLYEWDYHNRLIGVTTKDINGTITKAVVYTYDAYDRRIAKVIDADGNGPATATTERMVYDGDNIALTFDGTETQTHRYLYGPGIDQILADETQTSVNWALVDNQGTVRDVIDSNGVVLNHISYDSFGNVTSETNPNIDFRYGYTGREHDEKTGLYYYRTRYYDPIVGRFISEDTIGFNGGDANLYRYVGNSPINFTDPSGTEFPFVSIDDDGLRSSRYPWGGSRSSDPEIGNQRFGGFRGGGLGHSGRGSNGRSIPGRGRTPNHSDRGLEGLRRSGSGGNSGGSPGGASLPPKMCPISGRPAGLGGVLPLGRGSTGRTDPKNLNEQLAIKQAISNPNAGKPLPLKMSDPRWPASEGWIKKAQNINGVEVHYIQNTRTGQIDDFKFPR
jgi:RHS repeat-associated protein